MQQPTFWIGSDTPLYLFAIALLFAPDGCAKQFVFVLPVQIDGALAHACLASHVINGGLAIAPAHQQRGGDVQQALLAKLSLVRRRLAYRQLVGLCVVGLRPAGRMVPGYHMCPRFALACYD